MANRIITLCKDCNSCPVVELTPTVVKIGEEGNLCTLKLDEWESLRRKIISGEL